MRAPYFEQELTRHEESCAQSGTGGDPERAKGNWKYAENRNVVCPTVDYYLVQRFLQRFAPGRSHQWIEAAWESNQCSAAIPLVRVGGWDGLTGRAKTCRSMFPCWSLPNNSWMKTGGLFLDGEAEHSLSALSEKLCDQPSSLFSFPWVHPTKHWEALTSQLEARGCQVQFKEMFQSGFIEVDDDWDGYQKSLSKNHRKKLRKHLRNLEGEGPVKFVRLNRFENRQHLQSELMQAFSISHRGWKGDAGTSLLAHRGMLEFYTDVAWRMARQGKFELQLLKVGRRRIAFEFGFLSDRTYYSYKIGYDPDFRKFGPGQLLFYLQLQEWFQNREVDKVDVMGELTDAIKKWQPKELPVVQYVVANHGTAALWLKAVKKLKPLAKKLLGRG